MTQLRIRRSLNLGSAWSAIAYFWGSGTECESGFAHPKRDRILAISLQDANQEAETVKNFSQLQPQSDRLPIYQQSYQASV
jgi:hypothetical protein